ncbi:DUF2911 domain-containing protein [Marinoscillum sp. MHG1-6]|uniref:DUF2911 domain-containing protein n=1 Tax=Marinoscillum sp. MHG1-6 TaxID=2959627 RepID=UPI0021578120|nr:DUF2911 domain-containing protein [Marinoscillum sp. MHG1-6]
MKKVHFLAMMIMILCGTQTLLAQKDKSKRPSPPDQVSNIVEGTTITIDYSQPSLKGRDLNSLAPIGKVWRTGANEASWIEVSADVMIEGEKLPKGKYGFFTINNEDEWTLIFNEVWDQWGAYKYDSSKDALRVIVSPKSSEEFTEKFSISIGDNGLVQLLWGNLAVPFQISM